MTPRTPLAALTATLAKLGDTWDRVAASVVSAVRATPRRVGTALADRRHRRAGIIAGAVVLVLYLFAIGDLAVSVSGRWAGTPLTQTAPDNLFASRAPYLFEPVLALHPGSHLALFLSPLNLLLGAVVAALAGATVATARHTTCRRGYGRLVGVLPAFLLGFACCAPTLLLALGTSTGAALLPVLLPLRPIFYPLTLALLSTTLVWTAHRRPR